MNGLLDPKILGLLGASAGLLQASGPSTKPVSLGQAMGQGLLGGMQSYGMGKQFQEMDAMKQFRDAQIAELKRKGERDNRLTSILTGAPIMPQPPEPTVEKSLGGPVSLTPVGLQQPPVARPVDAPAPQASPVEDMRTKGQKLINAGFIAEGNQLLQSARALEPQGDVAQVNQILDLAGVTDPAQRQEIFKNFITKKTTHQPQVVVNTGSKETDKKFAGDFVDFATGGFADTQKQLGQLREVADALRSAKPGTLTGPAIGIQPRSAMAVTAPNALAAMEAVEEVGQRNLRLILGAQYTEREGERLISRVYNPMLPEAENLKRVERLMTQIDEAAKAKLDASQYFMKHGSLSGWKGKVWTMKDFEPDGGKTAPKMRISPETQRLLDKYAPQ